MPRTDKSFFELTVAGQSPGRFIADGQTRIDPRGLAAGSTLGAGIETFRGRAVLILAARQLSAALAALELDGIASRIVLAPPDLAPAHLPEVISNAAIDITLSDFETPGDIPARRCGLPITPTTARPMRDIETEWLLFTSGTTGRPKMVVHSLASLAGPLADTVTAGSGAVWSTFYDIRRYGGLQILLRALIGGGSMVLSEANEPVAAYLARAGAAGVTHISGTPSHWRRALMSAAAPAIAPAYLRLSGEVADQAILNHLAQTYQNANISHAFASTEAGVGFDIRDGQAGFPASLIGAPGAVELRVEDGSLRLRSTRIASRYANAAAAIADATGFVDTGDMVELRGARYHFVGRREGIINVGGQKVHPEEVEAVVNAHPAVRMSRVRGRPSPITGALVVADIVLAETAPATAREEILSLCRRTLPAHKVPVLLREVAALDIGASGKLLRVA